MASESKTTNNHTIIKKWVEAHQGKPSVVESTDNEKGGGLLRINFPGYEEDNLKEISWEKFFDIFDEHQLKLLYQDETEDGKESRFYKFVSE
ncbi:MAG TPA: hypothetical protein VFI78_07345 [Salinimicrobium sp.]|nr:hypothetical protein [Salinimicrobium sp.]